MAAKGTQKTSGWGVIGTVLAALAALVAVLSYLKIIPVCNFLSNCKPQFQFTYEGTGKPYYEVAEGLYYADSTNSNLLPFSITVEVMQYSGNQYSGEMDVVIEWFDRDQNKKEEVVGKWDNFRNQYKTPVKVDLSPRNLFQYSSLPGAISTYTWTTLEPSKGTFDVVVRYNDGRELARETVTVSHTPWYHEMLLNTAVVTPGSEITAHIRVHNFGDPAIFKVAGTLYQTTYPDVTSVMDGEDWWVERTWTSIYSDDIITESEIKEGGEYTTSLTIPGDYLESGNTYAVGVTVYKELPYIKLADPSVTWATSGERWRYRDDTTYLSVFVIQ